MAALVLKQPAVPGSKITVVRLLHCLDDVLATNLRRDLVRMSVAISKPMPETKPALFLQKNPSWATNNGRATLLRSIAEIGRDCVLFEARLASAEFDEDALHALHQDRMSAFAT